MVSPRFLGAVTSKFFHLQLPRKDKDINFYFSAELVRYGRPAVRTEDCMYLS